MNQISQFAKQRRYAAVLITACALFATVSAGCQAPGSYSRSTSNGLGNLSRSNDSAIAKHSGASHGSINNASAAAYGIDQLGITAVTDDVATRGSGQFQETTDARIKTADLDVLVEENQTSMSRVTYRAQSPAPPNPVQDSNVRPAAYQYPELQQQGPPGTFFQSGPSGPNGPSLNTGAPNTMQPLVYGSAPSGVVTFPQNYADLDVFLEETQTGRFNFGGAYNSDNGIVGQITIDERNFDIARFPRSFREIVDGTAWRGAGQSFRLELSPGANVERYLVSFGEPYLFNTPVSLTTSAYLFSRQYFDWNEERLGAKLSLGYRLTPFISVSAGVRAENVEISNVRVPGASADLDAVVGDTDLYVGHASLIRDTRDHPFLATTGSYLSMTFSQGFGEFDFSRGDIDFRRYRLMYSRPDGSGRHTVSMGTRLGFTGSQTPVFENYYAGGFSTMRGFDFRGASPTEAGVRVGGEFQWLNTVEYMFPLTADDMIKGVVFCDFGTVEHEIELNSENFRVAPGFGFRVHMPAAGIGAPLAFDFAFPVLTADGDDEKVFSFYLGVLK